MKRKQLALLIAVALLIGCLAIGAAAAEPVATIGTQGYDTLQSAIDAYNNSATPIQLLKDTAEAVTVSKDVYLDLNGCDVTGSVTVSAGTLYCMDSQTDDYTIQDANGYGQLTNVSGNVAGIPEEAACAEDGYLMVKEGNSYSFHRVNLRIYAMSLRAENVGLYYKSYFAGDEKVAENVEKFGIALSVKAIPTTGNLETQCKASSFTDFQPGTNDTASTSTLLKGVMKPTNAATANNHNSKMPVYGRAYVLTKDGKYLFGSYAQRSLREQVTLAASDTYWSSMDAAKQDAAVSMYRQYKDIMRSWNVTNIESRMCLNGSDPLPPANKESLKVLAITSSFGLNTTQLLYDVAVAEGYAPENVTVARLYTSGCTLKKHIANAPDKPVYQYTKISGDPEVVKEYDGTVGKMKELKAEGTATLLDGLLDEEWDIIFMQQGAREASIMTSYVDANGNDYITQLRNIMKPYVDQQCPDARFVWNMLWAYDEGSPQYPYNTTFNSDQMAMYQGSVDSTMKYVVPRTDYDRIIPSATAIQNARTSYFGETLSRDTYHLNNLGGTIAAYGLYAVITGQEITEINLDIVTASKTNGIGGAAKITAPFTDKQKAVIMESVNNALKNPFSVTESKYPPVDYSDYNYTDNLRFAGDTNYAVCPACNQEVQWTEINQTNVSTLDFIGTSAVIPSTTYHLYLSSDVTYTGSSFMLNMGGGSGIKVCFHLNGHDLTATQNGVAVLAGTAKLNMMGTGTVISNHSHNNKYRGSSFVLNSATTDGSGILRLYSGNYVQPDGNTQWAPVCTAQQGGLLEIYKDATLTGNADHYSLGLNTTNTNLGKTYTETVRIYGGTFNRPVYTSASGALDTTSIEISGGTFNDGIQASSGAVITLSGAPVIKGAGLVLPEGTTVTLGELTSGAKIAVNATGAFTEANTNAATYAAYFTSVTGNKITVNNNVLICQATSVYAQNLQFKDGTNTAYCAACGADKEWTEVNQTNLSSHTFLGTSSAMASGTYHLYLSSDVTYEGENFFLNMNGSGKNVCLHLNGNNLTATKNGIGLLSSSAKLNVMGSGTVIGNHTYSGLKYRGSAFVLNSATTNYSGILRLYSGTYVQPEGNIQLAPVCLAQQGGLLEIYEDATLTGNSTGYSLGVNTTNYNSSTKYNEKVRIYGGTFNRPAYFKAFGVTTADPTILEISGGTFNDGIEIVSHTTVTLSGAPVIKGAGLKLPAGTTVTLGTLTSGASIAVDATGAFTVANTLAADYVKYFSAVKSGYSISEADGVLSCSAN